MECYIEMDLCDFQNWRNTPNGVRRDTTQRAAGGRADPTFCALKSPLSILFIFLINKSKWETTIKRLVLYKFIYYLQRALVTIKMSNNGIFNSQAVALCGRYVRILKGFVGRKDYWLFLKGKQSSRIKNWQLIKQANSSGKTGFGHSKSNTKCKKLQKKM